MSHAPAHAHSHSVGTNLNVGKNLAAIGNDALKSLKNGAINVSNVGAMMQNTAKRITDILLKKPVSATLHLAGGPIAKVVDKTLSGVLKILTLGKIGEVKPLATVLKTTNSAVASIVNSVVDIKPQWTDREWHGTRGYIRHVKSKFSAWKQKNAETRAQKKADRIAKKAAKKEANHSHDDHHGHKTMAEKVDHHTEKKHEHPPHAEKHHDHAPKKSEHAEHAPEHKEAVVTKEPDHSHNHHQEVKHEEKHAETPTPATHAPAHDHADHSADKTNEASHEDNHPAGH